MHPPTTAPRANNTLRASEPHPSAQTAPAFEPLIFGRPPALSPLVGLHLERAGTTQWRAVDGSGRIVGHIEPLATPEGTRYRARRFKPAHGSFLELGSFWSADEAAWCLRYSA